MQLTGGLGPMHAEKKAWRPETNAWIYYII